MRLSARHPPRSGDGKRDGPPRARQEPGAGTALAVHLSAKRTNEWRDDSAAVDPPVEGEGRERSERGGVNAKRNVRFTPPRPPRSLRSQRRSTLPLQGRVGTE